MRPKIQECIVVEGKDDTIAVQRALIADTIETRGSAVPEEVLQQIELAFERRGVIIFTDPDAPGERIRRIVSDEIPGCKHAFLPRREAIRARDLGVENASPEAIREAFRQVHTEQLEEELDEAPVEAGELIAHGLLAGPDAKDRREALGEVLGIGYANGKQLQKRLRMFRISREEFEKAMAQVNAEWGEGE
ncbi:ribonuclease M5 [Salsuginibacillus halophilus]|nr:ribonuclease M5 [Salsuginibacillus halophilus]